LNDHHALKNTSKHVRARKQKRNFNHSLAQCAHSFCDIIISRTRFTCKRLKKLKHKVPMQSTAGSYQLMRY